MRLRSDGAILLTSELVTIDGGADTVPLVCSPSAESQRGRGLQLVDALAGDWGCYQHAQSTTTWLELGATT